MVLDVLFTNFISVYITYNIVILCARTVGLVICSNPSFHIVSQCQHTQQVRRLISQVRRYSPFIRAVSLNGAFFQYFLRLRNG
jgi:hypothetical protein